MSSSYDSGKTRDAGNATMASPCKKSKNKNKKHKWVTHFPTSPSWWKECQYCKATVYGK